MYKTLDFVIIKASKTVIALKQFSVPWDKQTQANFKNAFYIIIKRHIELMEKVIRLSLFLKLSAMVAIGVYRDRQQLGFCRAFFFFFGFVFKSLEC